ncbi:MAG: MGMT family protein [Desulfurococcaceae archaeon]
MLVVERSGKVVKVRRPNMDDICNAVYALTQLIPVGYVTSYGHIGKVLGIHPRVVARCLKINKNVIVVPCHRVVYGSRELGGYGGFGTDFKRKILELEGVTFKDNRVVAKHFVDLLL